MINRILITDNTHPVLIEGLQDNGLTYDYQPEITQDDTEKCIDAYIGIVVTTKIEINKAFIDKAKNLKFIGRLGSGMDNINIQYAEQKGIICFNSPEGNKNAVAEHTVGMLLSLLNNFNKADREVRKQQWLREDNRGIELAGKTIGIIGYGNTGSAFAKLLSGLDLNILAYDKYKSNYGNEQVNETDLKNIFNTADILSLHIPLTTETRYMVNKDFLSKFKKNIWLCNTSRGKIVDTKDLIEKIEEGKINGAALDVLENEDFNTYNEEEKKWFAYLQSSDKVILTPHIAGWSKESRRKVAEIIRDKIISIVT